MSYSRSCHNSKEMPQHTRANAAAPNGGPTGTLIDGTEARAGGAVINRPALMPVVADYLPQKSWKSKHRVGQRQANAAKTRRSCRGNILL
jgi:hypothetical protein